MNEISVFRFSQASWWARHSNCHLQIKKKKKLSTKSCDHQPLNLVTGLSRLLLAELVGCEEWSLDDSHKWLSSACYLHPRCSQGINTTELGSMKILSPLILRVSDEPSKKFICTMFLHNSLFQRKRPRSGTQCPIALWKTYTMCLTQKPK